MRLLKSPLAKTWSSVQKKVVISILVKRTGQRTEPQETFPCAVCDSRLVSYAWESKYPYQLFLWPALRHVMKENRLLRKLWMHRRCVVNFRIKYDSLGTNYCVVILDFIALLRQLGVQLCARFLAFYLLVCCHSSLARSLPNLRALRIGAGRIRVSKSFEGTCGVCLTHKRAGGIEWEDVSCIIASRWRAHICGLPSVTQTIVEFWQLKGQRTPHDSQALRLITAVPEFKLDTWYACVTICADPSLSASRAARVGFLDSGVQAL